MLASAHWRAGTLTEARQAAEVAARIAPDNPQILELLGDITAKMEQWPEAESAYRNALRIQPNKPEWYEKLGRVVRGQGRIDDAEAILQQGYLLEPERPWLLTQLGEVRWRKGNFTDAEYLLQRATALQPSLAPAHLYLAGIYIAMERWQEALEEARKVNVPASDPAGNQRFMQDASRIISLIEEHNVLRKLDRGIS